MRLAFRFSFVALLLFFVSHSDAAFIPGYPDAVEEMDSRDVAMLPRYCMATQNFRDRFHTDPAEVEYWKQVLGLTLNDMHHYCWAMMQTNRALMLARTAQVREFYLDSAVKNIDYVIRA